MKTPQLISDVWTG